LLGVCLIRSVAIQTALRADLLPSLFEEIGARLIRPSGAPLREDLGPIDELAMSISEKGLLQPIVVRPIEGGFEVVAGNRRLAACKSLGMRKIPCHVVELDDREAYEISLVENVQHKTLNPLEEARAFKRYVDSFGYGGESELARRIGKSPQYVSQRIRLLSLPDDVLAKVSRRLVSPSQAVELIGLPEEEQKIVSNMIVHERASSRSVRTLVRGMKDSLDPFLMADVSSEGVRPHKVLSKCIAVLRTSLVRLDEIIDHLDDSEWLLRETVAVQRASVHQQIDTLYALRSRLDRADSSRIPGMGPRGRYTKLPPHIK